MNKKGLSPIGAKNILLIICFLIIAILISVIVTNPAFDEILQRIKLYFEILLIIGSIISVLIFLWKIKFFKAIFGK